VNTTTYIKKKYIYIYRFFLNKKGVTSDSDKKKIVETFDIPKNVTCQKVLNLESLCGWAVKYSFRT